MPPCRASQPTASPTSTATVRTAGASIRCWSRTRATPGTCWSVDQDLQPRPGPPPGQRRGAEQCEEQATVGRDADRACGGGSPPSPARIGPSSTATPPRASTSRASDEAMATGSERESGCAPVAQTPPPMRAETQVPSPESSARAKAAARRGRPPPRRSAGPAAATGCTRHAHAGDGRHPARGAVGTGELGEHRRHERHDPAPRGDRRRSGDQERAGRAVGRSTAVTGRRARSTAGQAYPSSVGTCPSRSRSVT